MSTRSLAVAACLLLPALAATAQQATTAQLHIAPSDIVTPVSPILYGMMTEEINHAFDGGLYAELMQQPHLPRQLGWRQVEHHSVRRRCRRDRRA